MAGTARENIRNKGFWDGGAKGRSSNGQSGGRASGYPGERTPSTVGVRTDIEFPETDEPQEPQD